MVSMLGLLAVLIVSVTGCSSILAALKVRLIIAAIVPSYSANNVVVMPFYKKTSNNGNDFCVGVVRTFFSSASEPKTITLGLMPTEAEAGQIYQTTVTDTTDASYIARATAPSDYEAPAVQAW